MLIKETQYERLAALGVPQIEEKSGVVFVEDRMAREFARIWLRRIQPELLRAWRIVDVNSSGQIIQNLKNFPKLDGWFKAIGLLDGDEKGKGFDSEGGVVFLPGDKAPEIMLIEAVISKPKELAACLKIDSDFVQLSISSLVGIDHHDWILEFEKLLSSKGVNFNSLVEGAFDVWLGIDNNQQIAKVAFHKLKDQIKK